MSSVDNRVVEMEFDNKEFQQGIQSTLTSLDQLNKGLKLEGATKGLNDVATATSKFSIAGIAAGVDSIASKFTAMGAIALSAIGNIVNKAVDAGITLVKSFTLDPITAGFDNYETQIKAVQTILANTSQEGTKLADVNKVLAELNTYANQTVYNFSEMTANIGTFTAAGVDLQTSANSIKGIANLAALSGSNSQQAATAMYQLSQAIAAGSVKLQDWNSVVNAGLGGKTFQTALENTARASGVAIDSIIKKNGSFRESLQEGWLTSDILTKTLSQFTGDLSKAQIEAMGYTSKEADSILALGKTAVDAATKIKTMSQLTDALKEEVATAYATIFKTIFGNIGEATDLFSSAHTVLENALTGPIYALNNLLVAWDKLGGRTKLIDAIKNAFKDLEAVIKPIEGAFREIFPPATGEDLYNITVFLDNLTKKLKIGADTANEIKRSFAGVFAVFDIGWQIVKQVVKTFFDLFGMLDTGNGGFLKFTANIGDFLVGIDKTIKSGDGLTTVFHNIEKVLAGPIELLNKLRGYLDSLFDGFDGDGAAKQVSNVASSLVPLTDASGILSKVWDKIKGVLEGVYNTFEPIAEKLTGFFSTLGPTIASAFSGVNYQDILATINTGLFAGLVVSVKKLIDKFKDKGDDASGGFLDTIKESIEGLTDTFKTMQNTLRAATLLEIAAAIGILTIACVALSKIDSAGLVRALTAMTVMFTQLGASLYVLEKSMSDKKLLKLYLVTGALSLLAIAIDLLTIAVKSLSGLSWDELAKGLTGVTALLGVLVVTMKLMPNPAGLISTGIGMIALATAINILVKAVTSLSGLSWGDMAKGLVGVGVLLTSLALFSKFAEADAGGILAGAGIILLATGIEILADATKKFGGYSWGEIGKGLVAMAGALTIIGVALDAIPPTAPLAAAGVLIVALSLGDVADSLKKMGDFSWGEIGKGLTAMLGALTIISAALDVISPAAPLSAAAILVTAIALGQIADVLDQFAQMSWGEIGKAMTVLAGSLILISGAMTVMIDALPGAAALLVVSASLAILAPILTTFGAMSWGAILKGLTELAGVFAVLGVAGLLLTPVVPTLVALGVAIALIGAGVALAGVGVLAFSIALTALSVAGAAATGVIVGMVTSLAGLIPTIATQVGLGVTAFAKTIATSGPAFTSAITTVLTSLLTAIDTMSPKIVSTLQKLLDLMLSSLVKNVPKMTDAGLKILIGFLDGVANNIGKVVTSATNVIVNFLNGISKNLPRITNAGVNLIISFVNGLADSIRSHTSAMDKAGANLAGAIIDGMTGGLLSGISKVTSAAKRVAKSALDAAENLLGIHSPSREFMDVGKFSALGMANGLDAYSKVVAKSASEMGGSTLQSFRDSLSGMSDLIDGNLNLVPTITPVLDLTNVQNGSKQLGTLLAPPTVGVKTSLSNAKNASAGFQENQSALNDVNSNKATAGGVTYNQYNNSPKALSTVEIYRQTKNQLSTAKAGLPD